MALAGTIVNYESSSESSSEVEEEQREKGAGHGRLLSYLGEEEFQKKSIWTDPYESLINGDFKDAYDELDAMFKNVSRQTKLHLLRMNEFNLNSAAQEYLSHNINNNTAESVAETIKRKLAEIEAASENQRPTRTRKTVSEARITESSVKLKSQRKYTQPVLHIDEDSIAFRYAKTATKLELRLISSCDTHLLNLAKKNKLVNHLYKPSQGLGLYQDEELVTGLLFTGLGIDFSYEITMVATAKNYRGHGYGRILYESLLLALTFSIPEDDNPIILVHPRPETTAFYLKTFAGYTTHSDRFQDEFDQRRIEALLKDLDDNVNYLVWTPRSDLHLKERCPFLKLFLQLFKKGDFTEATEHSTPPRSEKARR
mmetsp:Transcript_14587/g.19440  ORF Transcript_14587/g.19440 Transcript_14587/m.19440 type:complete len:370 (-) Transcript_14587:168-1277(-)|eukprot:CAMPEP_0197287242 /NCGR_PEP_ID=MMETSP0890-20130614/3424_1 /TAXON_ID=44058 ORGANISM="Aureoumbra lagunensis, Strain CCMP1510" /NCGR_SAMPLE_ID=MMETSP0890 /ASSEMBLY_ACC=CAM_ASM_000533 /LENGTH=369 /DNA_ID=CAMNT_0042756667 /DNA_START=831 /DNA_END=1940 /DNA_ORIENTATION=+